MSASDYVFVNCLLAVNAQPPSLPPPPSTAPLPITKIKNLESIRTSPRMGPAIQRRMESNRVKPLRNRMRFNRLISKSIAVIILITHDDGTTQTSIKFDVNWFICCHGYKSAKNGRKAVRQQKREKAAENEEELLSHGHGLFVFPFCTIQQTSTTWKMEIIVLNDYLTFFLALSSRAKIGPRATRKVVIF